MPIVKDTEAYSVIITRRDTEALQGCVSIKELYLCTVQHVDRKGFSLESVNVPILSRRSIMTRSGERIDLADTLTSKKARKDVATEGPSSSSEEDDFIGRLFCSRPTGQSGDILSELFDKSVEFLSLSFEALSRAIRCTSDRALKVVCEAGNRRVLINHVWGKPTDNVRIIGP